MGGSGRGVGVIVGDGRGVSVGSRVGEGVAVNVGASVGDGVAVNVGVIVDVGVGVRGSVGCGSGVLGAGRVTAAERGVLVASTCATAGGVSAGGVSAGGVSELVGDGRIVATDNPVVAVAAGGTNETDDELCADAGAAPGVPEGCKTNSAPATPALEGADVTTCSTAAAAYACAAAVACCA